MPTGIYTRASGEVGSPSIALNCARCGIQFTAKASHSGRRRFCSKECQYSSKTERALETRTCKTCGKEFQVSRYKPNLNCSNKCAQKSISETKRSWYKNKEGYIVTHKYRKCILQHRYVMEQHLGRPLKPFENVHHKNGIRDDNRLENLELWVKRQPPGQRIEEVTEWAVALLESQGYTVTAPKSR